MHTTTQKKGTDMKSAAIAFALLAALAPAQAAKAQDAVPTALVIIDIQDFYYPGGLLPLVAPEAAGANAAQLLARAREQQVMVVHVGHNASAGRGFHADVAPREGEAVVMKDDVNAFLGTDLKQRLEAAGIKRLVICGMQTHMCVEAATRAASDLGYEVLLVGEACATRDLKHGDTVVPAAQVHTATLATLDRTYAKVVDVQTALDALATQRNAFTAVTLNIWHDQKDWPARRAVMLDTLRALKPDVIFLQEVLEKEGLPNQAQQLADSLGCAFVFVSVDPPGGPKRYGNAILTRHRIAETHETTLAPADDYRVAAHARIEAHGTMLDTYVTHLHHTDEGAAIRAEQVRALIAFVDATHESEDGALLIGGDFNAAADSPELAPLRARYRDTYEAVHPGDDVTTLNPAIGHAPRRIDHLFIDAEGLRPLAAEVFLDAPTAEGIWASDHFGVWARLEVVR